MDHKKTKKVALFKDLNFALMVFGLALLCALIYIIFSPEIKYEIDPNLAARKNQPKGQKAGGIHTKKVQAKKIDPKTIKFLTIRHKDNGSNFSNRKPDFIRKEKKYVFSTNGNKTAWGGTKDVSMDVWIGHDNKALLITADIFDDKTYAAATTSSDIYRYDCIQFSFFFDFLKDYNRQWELGLLMDENGKHFRHCWLYPGAMRDQAKNLLKSVLYGVESIPGGRRHNIVIPFNEKIGLTLENLKKGIRFDLIYNDADDKKTGRKQWIEISPGIAQNKEKAYFPRIIFDQ